MKLLLGLVFWLTRKWSSWCFQGGTSVSFQPNLKAFILATGFLPHDLMLRHVTRVVWFNQLIKSSWFNRWLNQGKKITIFIFFDFFQFFFRFFQVFQPPYWYFHNKLHFDLFIFTQIFIFGKGQNVITVWNISVWCVIMNRSKCNLMKISIWQLVNLKESKEELKKIEKINIVISFKCFKGSKF